MPTTAVDHAPPKAAELSGARTWVRHFDIFTIAGIVLPLAAIIWSAHLNALSFDGGMNMQVAQNLAQHGTFSRFYGVETTFPLEIQTSSYFILLTAGAIRLFGTNNMSLQAANIIFCGILLIAISQTFPRSRVARLLVPSAILFGAPGLLASSMGGYGEGSTAALALFTFILISKSFVSFHHRLRYLALAFAVAGIAISIKTFAIAILPVALLGLLIVWSQSRNSRRWPLLLTPLAAFVPIAGFEAFRLASLGNTYIPYWLDQFSRISYMATGRKGAQGIKSNILSKVAGHFHLLSIQTGVAAEWWLALLVTVPVSMLVAFWMWRKFEWPKEYVGQALIAAQLLFLSELYFVWWLAFTPNEKVWLRRISVGIFALILVATLVAHLSQRALRRGTTLGHLRLAIPIASSAISLLVVVVALSPTLANNIEASRTRSVRADDLFKLVQTVNTLDKGGSKFFGIEWWSAPVVSVYADVDFYNLQTADLCSRQFSEIIDSGKAYLIWDFYAENLSKPVPTMTGVVFTPTKVKNSYGELWTISLAKGRCA